MCALFSQIPVLRHSPDHAETENIRLMPERTNGIDEQIYGRRCIEIGKADEESPVQIPQIPYRRRNGTMGCRVVDRSHIESRPMSDSSTVKIQYAPAKYRHLQIVPRNRPRKWTSSMKMVGESKIVRKLSFMPPKTPGERSEFQHLPSAGKDTRRNTERSGGGFSAFLARLTFSGSVDRVPDFEECPFHD